MPKIDPRASLADDFTNPRCIDPSDPYDAAVAQGLMAKCRRYVFDQAATDMAADLALLPPAQLARLLDACRPASEHVWIEMPVRDFFENSEFKPVGVDTRCALLAQWNEATRSTHCMLIHHSERPLVRWWAPGFLIAHEGKPFKEHISGYGDQLRRGLWGFDYDPGPELWGRARITVSRSMGEHIRESGKDLMVPAGWTRFAIGALTILNSRSIEVSEPVRPAGQRLIGGLSRPYTSLTPLRLSLPRRVRNRTGYLAREAAVQHTRRRLHEVNPHYRHLRRCPTAPGWQQIEIEGETFWRKRIDAFLRGDPDLGVVEHEVTIVKGLQT
jgi:hypothetical protein